MLKALKASLAFMTPQERAKWHFMNVFRALLSLLDLVGILAIGFVLTSTAIFLTSGSDPGRVIEFAGIALPAVNAETLPWASIFILVLFLAKALASLALTKKAAYFVATIEARSAKTIAEISFGGDLVTLRKRSKEEIMFAIQGGSPAAFNGLLNSVSSFAAEGTLFVVIGLSFFMVDPLASLMVVTYFGLVAFLIHYFVGSLMSESGKVAAEAAVRANVAISNLISVFRELIVLNKREKFIQDIYSARRGAANSSAAQFYLTGMPRFIIEAALLIGVALFVVGQSLTGDIVKAAATLGVFLSGGFRLTAALLPMQNALFTIKVAIPSAQLAHDILGFAPPKVKPPLTLEDSNYGQPELYCFGDSANPLRVEFDAVSFSYPDSLESVLQNVSFKIEPGSQVALMGPSGAGKSTIADLLCGVLRPKSGSITIGESGTQADFSNTRNRVSYVPQRPGLVSGTLLENLALSQPLDRIDRTKAREALKKANLIDLIESLPQGLDTSLGAQKDNLSGGQMQRLGLARALYSNPGLLVMDEATSALDAQSEAEIQKALDSMRGKVTVVLIAHRLNTIQHADKVILVEEGSVKDSGTFKELIARNPSVERVVDLMRVEKD